MLSQIGPDLADALYAAIKSRDDGTTRITTASKCMKSARRAWNVVYRLHSNIVPSSNPFSKMELESSGGANVPATRDQLDTFVATADAMGHFSMGTAAMVAFEWLQRETDIIGRLSWVHYRPADKPDCVKIRHNKTNQEIWQPLEEVEGNRKVLLYPELDARLQNALRIGSLIIMRDKPDKKRKIHLPYQESWFQHLSRKIMDEAGLPSMLTFTSFRHGGMTELGDAELTDQQMMALSAHKQRSMLTVYSKRTEKQRRSAARKRLIARTNEGRLSE